MRFCEEFLKLKGINDLAQILVEVNKVVVYPLVFLLVKLALILPALVERISSMMKLVKIRIHNQIMNDWLSDYLVTYIEKKYLKVLIMRRSYNVFNT
jgi:hypothetical protein